MADEIFQPQSFSNTSGETFILWGSAFLDPSGAASRGIYPLPTGASPTNYTPSINIQFDQSAPGFDKNNFKWPYRPIILLNFSLVTSQFSGTTTQITVNFYINNTLVRSTVLSGLLGGQIQYGFAMKGLGDFSFQRPPDNNVLDSKNGWVYPVIKFSATADSGVLSISQGTSLIDAVINYPV